MFDRFSDRARKVMALARQESNRLRHGEIRPEHILLGLVIEGTGVAANVVENLDVELKRVREALEPVMLPGTADTSAESVPFTPAGKKTIELAIREARALDHNYIGTEHLLLGLLRESDGIAAKVLLQFGLELEMTRNEIREFLGIPGSEAEWKEAEQFAGLNTVLGMARNEAVRNGRCLIEPEHLLAGIVVHLGYNERWGIDFTALLRALDNYLLPRGVSENTPALKYSADSEEVLRLTLKRTLDLNSVSAGPEHLIMGILELGRGPAFDALALQNVTLENFREKFRPTT